MSRAKKNIIRTGEEVGSDAGKTLQSEESSKLEKELAGSALTNRKEKTKPKK